MDVRAQTQDLTTFEGRLAGSDAERRAASRVRDHLTAIGHGAEVEPTLIRPRWAAAQAIATTIAVVGSVLAVSSPGIGMALVLVAATSSIGEATGAFALLSRLTGSRASQNVASTRGAEKEGVLLLVASCDAPTDAAFDCIARRLRDPWLVIGGSLLTVLACCAIRLLGFEGVGLTTLQLIPTLVLLAATPLLVDAELSPAGRGQPEAAGAAAVLALADELAGELSHLEVRVLVTGARAPHGQGMRAWLRRHLGELDRERTVVLAVEAIGSGGVRYTRREGTRLLSWRTNPDLVRLCGDIAADDEDGAAFDAQPCARHETGDAVAALARGLPAIGVTTDRREPTDPDAERRVRAFCAELARRVDHELAPRLDEEPLRQE